MLLLYQRFYSQQLNYILYLMPFGTKIVCSVARRQIYSYQSEQYLCQYLINIVSAHSFKIYCSYEHNRTYKATICGLLNWIYKPSSQFILTIKQWCRIIAAILFWVMFWFLSISIIRIKMSKKWIICFYFRMCRNSLLFLSWRHGLSALVREHHLSVHIRRIFEFFELILVHICSIIILFWWAKSSYPKA